MTLSINCKDAGDPICTHTMYGETRRTVKECEGAWYQGTWLYRRNLEG